VSAAAVNPLMWDAAAIDSRPRPTLLWIDDFLPALELYKASFERLGFNVLTASSGEEGVSLAASNDIDAVVTDFEMAGMNGDAVATAIKSLNSKTPVIMFSGSTLIPLRTRRVVDAFCDKAGSRDRLLNVLHRLLHKKGVRTLQPPPVAQASHHGHRTVA
jgi:CheY-like chemotaxis protein